MTPNRNIRQRELVPPDSLDRIQATVIGVGAIGRQVAIQLATIGVPKIKLIDFDTVQIENLGAQGFNETDLGCSKVGAVSESCLKVNGSIDVSLSNSRFNPLLFPGGVVFCCVDKIEVRESIFNKISDRSDLFIDGRMSAEYMRILSVFNKASAEHYRTTLFKASEAYRGTCTAKTTFYCSSIAAGMMVAQFAKWLRGCEVDCDVSLNLLTNEMEAHGVPINQ